MSVDKTVLTTPTVKREGTMMPLHTSMFAIVFSMTANSLAGAQSPQAYGAFPPEISHLEVESDIEVTFDAQRPDPAKRCAETPGKRCERLVMKGTLAVLRGGPVDTDEDRRFELAQEIIFAETRGFSKTLGRELVLRQGGRRTVGKTVQQAAGRDFPADSWFDVFIEISVPADPSFPVISNTEPIRVSAVIDKIPPVGISFSHAPGVATPLRSPSGDIVAWTTFGDKATKKAIDSISLGLPARR